MKKEGKIQAIPPGKGIELHRNTFKQQRQVNQELNTLAQQKREPPGARIHWAMRLQPVFRGQAPSGRSCVGRRGESAAAWIGACALELVHTYSLIPQQDLPSPG